MSVWLAGLALSIQPGSLMVALNDWADTVDYNIVFASPDFQDLVTEGFQCEDCNPFDALNTILEPFPVRMQISYASGNRPVVAVWRERAGSGAYHRCVQLSLWAMQVLNPVDKYMLRLGMLDISDKLLCYPGESQAHVWSDPVDEVVVRPTRRLWGWGPRR